ncbi:AfsR/SARP family transcriptional regulator [Allokutzneria oryzae]|uniref:BTAD domain-containing putative transcriptional regulator n=1 Tax=Allokutzneria oryzae TaxID=1378989 RepID=A0ABV6A8E8_9PSEU
MGLRFGVLGEIEALRGQQRLEIGPARQRAVLAVLLAEANRVVPLDRLAERVWGRDQPQRTANTVRSYLSRLRSALPGTTIERRGEGYVLETEPESVDLHRFRALVARARSGDRDEGAAELLAEALGLWRGEPFSGMDTAWAADTRTALLAERLGAELDHNDIQLRLGGHGGLLPNLLSCAAEHPLHERLVGQLMLALYRDGRPADALEQYQHLRSRLSEELGTEPGPALRELHHQVLADDPALPGAPPRVANAPVPRQLPAAPRLFVGRGRELTALTRRMEIQREAGEAAVALAVDGPGGIGKTWLALTWAHANLDRFPDGQLYVNLRGFAPQAEPVPPSQALRAFLEALGVADTAIPADLDARSALFRSLVAGRRMLIVLDNARDSAHLVPLLPADPACTVLITSRDRLTGLAAGHGVQPLDLELLGERHARDLLTEHLGAHRVRAEPGAVRELLSCCGGLPLALGIVSARAIAHPDFPLSVLAEELRDASARLDALDVDDTELNLRTVLSWSSRALDPHAAKVFATLGLAPGPDIALPAAAALTGLSRSATRVVLRTLETANLVWQPAPGRYRMHDLVRLHASEQAEGSLSDDERRAALRRLLDHLLWTGHRAALLMKPNRTPLELAEPVRGADPVELADRDEAAAWFTAERLVVLAAIDVDWPEYTWRLAWMIADFLEQTCQWHEYVGSQRKALAAAQELGDLDGEARASRNLARGLGRVGTREESMEHLERALELSRERGDRFNEGMAHLDIGMVHNNAGDLRGALTCVREALAVFEAAGHRHGQAMALNNIGWCLAELGELRDALAYCHRALALQEETGEPGACARTMDSIGYCHHRLGEHAEAVTWLNRALDSLPDNDLGSRIEALTHLGDARHALGEHDAARTAWLTAADLAGTTGGPAADALRERLGGHVLTPSP